MVFFGWLPQSVCYLEVDHAGDGEMCFEKISLAFLRLHMHGNTLSDLKYNKLCYASNRYRAYIPDALRIPCEYI